VTQEFKLPALMWPQIWRNDYAVDADSPIKFDAHDSMLELSAFAFSRTAQEVLSGRGHDYDDIALKAGVIDDWLSGRNNATFYVDIDAEEFRQWLEYVGLTEDEAVAMDEAAIEELRARVQAPNNSVPGCPAAII
jgi:hypothetical protein